jgi:hypothetical protein
MAGSPQCSAGVHVSLSCYERLFCVVLRIEEELCTLSETMGRTVDGPCTYVRHRDGYFIIMGIKLGFERNLSQALCAPHEARSMNLPKVCGPDPL